MHRLWLSTLLILAAGLAPAIAADYLQASPRDLAWWREARFGMFVHWGPVSLKGTEISWSRAGKQLPFGEKGGQIPTAEYDSLYKQFNPTEFNPDEWVATAKAAGMKYLIFTTKHHDGFCEFDSALTDYKITNSPYGRDVVKQLADACHRGGLRLGFYYSAPDWHHPDFWTDNHARYIEYFRGQVREICSNYGKVSILWFDCGGPPERYDTANIFKMIRELQPGIIINDRLGLPADYRTPEQEVGTFDNKRPWESCITICNQWAYKPNDDMKSLSTCIRTLVSCAGGDGNLLFNVGPMPTGEIEPRQVERLREMGAWLKKYGRSVYGTRGGPYMPGAWGCSTYRGDTVYLHVFRWRDGALQLPKLTRKVLAVSALTGGKPELKQDWEGIEISLPAGEQDAIDTVIELKLDGPAADIPPITLPSASLATRGRSSASNVCGGDTGNWGSSKAFDDDSSTRWATDAGTSSAWLQVDLGRYRTFDRATISEAIDRVREFELQYECAGEWRTFHKGTTIGPKLEAKFEPVTARRVRLNIVRATEGPTIWEFQLLRAIDY